MKVLEVLPVVPVVQPPAIVRVELTEKDLRVIRMTCGRFSPADLMEHEDYENGDERVNQNLYDDLRAAGY